MKSNMLVSVVVPIYNQEKYLDKSIQALLNQTYPNIEIVLVNDGSTDLSFEIIKRYEVMDNRIVVVDKQNGGLVDATIAGIYQATGEYIAFLDSDDFIENKFIENFVVNLDDSYDFIAMGFYYENRGRLTPYILSEDKIYNREEIQQLKGEFLTSRMADVFVSRWNKLYKRECLLKTMESFSNCKEISLGEDSIFTYLMLSNAVLGKTIMASNSYYYNIGNQESMTKNESIKNHLDKSYQTFNKFSEILKDNGDSNRQAYALYYNQVDSLLKRVQKTDTQRFSKLYWQLKKDKIFKNSLSILLKETQNKREKVQYITKRILPNAKIYNFVTISLRYFLRRYKKYLIDLKLTVKKIRKNGLIKSCRFMNSRIRRRKAFEDIYKKFPLLQKRIEPILKKYEGKVTDFTECPICKNIFVFWWDGLDKAPIIVKKCLESVKKYHSDSNVVLITKYNYREYTNIHPIILKDFECGKISVQTFSDILRFNLLMNNGGTWIDSTIFFTRKYDLTETLVNKPIESVEFATSKDFLKYQDTCCSWSGYFIASRKNSVFVRAVNEIFEQYYLKYKTYTTYFFIDAVLMLSKINGLDGSALDHISYNSGDMFVLGDLLYTEYNPVYYDVINKIPQKLDWGMKYSDDEKTNYTQILIKNNA